MKNEIISNLNCGWADFNLGYHERISFIRDIPEDILNGISSYKATGVGAIEFDCEGHSFTLLMKESGCLIIEEKDDIQIIEIDEIPNDICLNLFNCIKIMLKNGWNFKTEMKQKNTKKVMKTIFNLILKLLN